MLNWYTITWLLPATSRVLLRTHSSTMFTAKQSMSTIDDGQLSELLLPELPSDGGSFPLVSLFSVVLVFFSKILLVDSLYRHFRTSVRKTRTSWLIDCSSVMGLSSQISHEGDGQWEAKMANIFSSLQMTCFCLQLNVDPNQFFSIFLVCCVNLCCFSINLYWYLFVVFFRLVLYIYFCTWVYNIYVCVQNLSMYLSCLFPDFAHFQYYYNDGQYPTIV